MTTYGAQPTDHVHHPPCGLVEWRVWVRGSQVASVMSQSWFDARRQAMVLLQCDGDQIQCTLT